MSETTYKYESPVVATGAGQFQSSICGMATAAIAILSLVLLLTGSSVSGISADEPQTLGTSPVDSGRFAWNASQPLVTPTDHGGDRCYSVKDPSIVRHNGLWHLFCTVRSEHRTHQIEYRSFADWKDADQAKPHLLDLTDGYHCAPQVFYFAPQKTWYLIYQVQDSSRSPSLQPAYSTTGNLADPKSWSKPKLLFDEHPDNVKMWIDFWVICDDDRAHLFFTSHAGWMWRSETPLDQFPTGWSKPEVVLRSDIFEASHTYRLKGRLKGQDHFLTLVEAQDGKQRYLKAFTAERLDGKWSPHAATKEKSLASLRNVQFDGHQWTDSISHPEFLRAGFDQNLEIDPNDLRILFQGTTSETLADRKYGEIPWKLGLLTLDDDDEQASRGEFPYKRWTVDKPFFKAGPARTFDEVSAKDPSIVRHGGKWHLFYYVKDERKYLALLEAVRPHPTKRNYWDSRNRFVFAMVANSLEGPWQRVESGKNDFIGLPEYVFHGDGSRTLHDQISHPELIRLGFDELLEVKDYHLKMMFQAFDAANTPDSYDYDMLPWKLSIMRNY